jgi:hypothetical protein
MTVPDEYKAIVEAVQKLMVEETAAVVESGAAVLEFEDAGADLRPTSDVQSDTEVSFFPTAPGTTRTLTIDVFDKDAAALVGEVRAYVRAFLAGRVELTLRRGSSAGRVRVWLEDGRKQTHPYNVYNVILGCLVGHWDTFRPTPY